MDAVVVLNVLAESLYYVRLADIGVFLQVGIQHRGNQCFKVDVVVSKIGGVFAGNPVGAVNNLLEIVLVYGELAGAVGLNFNSAVGALKNAGSNLFHLNGKLLGGGKHMAELQGDVIIVICRGGETDAAEGSDHHNCEE